MSENVIGILQSQKLGPIWTQQLRVAAYCRVSTKQEDQLNSYEVQMRAYTEKIKSSSTPTISRGIPIGSLSLSTTI